MPSIGQVLLAECNKKNLHFQTSLTTTIFPLFKFLGKTDPSLKSNRNIQVSVSIISTEESSCNNVHGCKNILVQVTSLVEKLLFQR